jgi:hypothetical protein
MPFSISKTKEFISSILSSFAFYIQILRRLELSLKRALNSSIISLNNNISLYFPFSYFRFLISFPVRFAEFLHIILTTVEIARLFDLYIFNVLPELFLILFLPMYEKRYD